MANINLITSYLAELFSDIDNLNRSNGFISMWNSATADYVTDSNDWSMDIIRGSQTISTINPTSLIVESSLDISKRPASSLTYQNQSHGFPIIKEKATVAFEDTWKRLPGQLPVTNTHQLDRNMANARVLLSRNVKDNLGKIAGVLEKVAIESLTTGKITLSNGFVYDFNRASTNTTTPAILWDVPATALPINDLENHYETIRNNGTLNPQAVVMGGEAVTAFFETDQVKSLAGSRRIAHFAAGDNMPALPPEIASKMTEEKGFNYQAFVTTAKGYKLYIFTYNETYQDNSFAHIDYFNPKNVLMFNPALELRKYFGPVTEFQYETPEENMINRIFGLTGMTASFPMGTENVFDARMFHHKPIFTKDKTLVGLETYTRPVYAPTQVDAAGQLVNVVS